MVGDLPFRTVLDVGCGQGSPLEDLMELRPGIEGVGVDFSAAAVEMARRRSTDARYEVLDIATDTLPRKFDLVICTDVVEHIPDDRAALRNMHAMCGGYCLVSTIQGRMRPSEVRVGHVRNYRRGELRAKMEEAGFRVVRQYEWGFPLYSPLYRDLLERLPERASTGKFTPLQHVASKVLYYAFMLNSYRRGDYVFCLGVPRRD
jgi:SAM-dependent methyltransferase